MDRAIEKKKWTKKRIMLIAGGGTFVLLLVLILFSTMGRSKLNVESERMTIAEAKQSNFREFIPVTGTIQPISTIYLDLQEGGRVEEIFVEDGALLTARQPILRLGNTDLELNIVNQETNVYNMLMQMQLAQINALSNDKNNSKFSTN